jgi:hypothetical protein
MQDERRVHAMAVSGRERMGAAGASRRIALRLTQLMLTHKQSE